MVMIERLEELLTVESVADGEYRRRSARHRSCRHWRNPRQTPESSRLVRPARRALRSGQLRDEPGRGRRGRAVLIAPTSSRCRRTRRFSAPAAWPRPCTSRSEESHDSGRFARRRLAFGQQERSFFACDVGFHKPDERDGGWQREPPSMPDPESLATAPSSFPAAGHGSSTHWAGRTSTLGATSRFRSGRASRRECRTSPAWSAAALSFAADYFPAQSMLLTSGRSPDTHYTRTLEHSMWFHRVDRPVTVDAGPLRARLTRRPALPRVGNHLRPSRHARGDDDPGRHHAADLHVTLRSFCGSRCGHAEGVEVLGEVPNFADEPGRGATC